MRILINITVESDEGRKIKEDNYLLPGYDSYDIQRMILDRSNVTDIYEFKLIAERDNSELHGLE